MVGFGAVAKRGGGVSVLGDAQNLTIQALSYLVQHGPTLITRLETTGGPCQPVCVCGSVVIL